MWFIVLCHLFISDNLFCKSFSVKVLVSDNIVSHSSSKGAMFVMQVNELC